MTNRRRVPAATISSLAESIESTPRRNLRDRFGQRCVFPLTSSSHLDVLVQLANPVTSWSENACLTRRVASLGGTRVDLVHLEAPGTRETLRVSLYDASRQGCSRGVNIAITRAGSLTSRETASLLTRWRQTNP